MKIKSQAAEISLVSQDVRWAALEARRGDGEAPFFYGVKTTRVFCRSNCRSRLPKRENVIFFNTADEALGAGFRPCKRCQPDSQPYNEEVNARITHACRMLEHADAPVALKARPRSSAPSEF